MDGHTKQVRAIISKIPETGEHVVSFLDVTSNLHIEEGLWESEERFGTIFDGAVVGMTMADLQEGRILANNPAMQKMLGYTAKELSRMQFTKFTHPDDVESQWVLHKETVAGNLKHFEIKKR